MDQARFFAIFVSLISTFSIIAYFLSSKHWEAVQDKARARRLADHLMNARLLRLNI